MKANLHLTVLAFTTLFLLSSCSKEKGNSNNYFSYNGQKEEVKTAWCAEESYGCIIWLFNEDITFDEYYFGDGHERPFKLIHIMVPQELIGTELSDTKWDSNSCPFAFAYIDSYSKIDIELLSEDIKNGSAKLVKGKNKNEYILDLSIEDINENVFKVHFNGKFEPQKAFN